VARVHPFAKNRLGVHIVAKRQCVECVTGYYHLPTTVFFPRRTCVELVSFAVSRQTRGREGKSVEAVMLGSVMQGDEMNEGCVKRKLWRCFYMCHCRSTVSLSLQFSRAV
jgi:hypothetical protein